MHADMGVSHEPKNRLPITEFVPVKKTIPSKVIGLFNWHRFVNLVQRDDRLSHLFIPVHVIRNIKFNVCNLRGILVQFP